MNMKAIRRILFAVKNPEAGRQPGIDKAIHIAQSLGASLELFHAFSASDEPPESALAPLRARLEKHAARARAAGVRASATVAWDRPAHEAIVRRATVARADIIVAECHQGRRLAPWLIRLTDWELIRISAIPVLLLKNTKRWNRPAILAAVDPAHARAKPSGLDRAIIGWGRQLEQKLRGEMTVMHANLPPFAAFSSGNPTIGAANLSAAYTAQRERAAREFVRFAVKNRVPPARRRIVEDTPDVAIPLVARKLRVEIVVMGAISRSGIARVFIGDTAERVLGSLPCDILVVKPRS